MTKIYTENQPGREKKDTIPYIEPTYKLNYNQELFCNEYLKDRNATKAYIRAGYAVEGARQNAARLIANDSIKWHINELIAEQINKIKLDVSFVIKELLKHATIDISDAYDEDGVLKPISEMPEPLRKAIVGIETEEEFSGTGEDREQTGFTKTIKLTDKIKAIELLGKHLKMFTDIHEIPGLEGLAEQIKAARKRAEKCRLV